MSTTDTTTDTNTTANTMRGIASEGYHRQRRDIDLLLTWLGEEMAAMDAAESRNPRNWEFSGMAGHIRVRLAEIAGSLCRLNRDGVEREIIRRRRGRKH